MIIFSCFIFVNLILNGFLPWWFINVVSFHIYIPSMQRNVDVLLTLKNLDQFIIFSCVLTRQMEIFFSSYVNS
jgi:uncharacterized membrane protein